MLTPTHEALSPALRALIARRDLHRFNAAGNRKAAETDDQLADALNDRIQAEFTTADVQEPPC